MTRSLLARLAGVLISIPVYGGVISTQTFDFLNRSGVVQATVTVTVLDNYHGDPTKQDWIYTIDNLSYTTVPPPNYPVVGLQAFGTGYGAFQSLTYKHVSDVTGVSVTGNNPYLMGDISPGFCWQCDLSGGGWWLTYPAGFPAGLGVLPGQSATVDYSWLKVPGAVTTGIAADAFLGVVVPYAGGVSGALLGSTLVPRSTLAPEPVTSGLTGFALFMFGSVRWRQKRVRTRARRTL